MSYAVEGCEARRSRMRFLWAPSHTRRQANYYMGQCRARTKLNGSSNLLGDYFHIIWRGTVHHGNAIKSSEKFKEIRWGQVFTHPEWLDPKSMPTISLSCDAYCACPSERLLSGRLAAERPLYLRRSSSASIDEALEGASSPIIKKLSAMI